MYPDVVNAGGLGPAVARELAAFGDEEIALESHPGHAVVLRREDRSVGLHLTVDKCGFTIGCHDPRMQHGYGWTSDLRSAVSVARAFATGTDAAMLAREHDWFVLWPGIKEFLAGPVEYTAWQWAHLRAMPSIETWIDPLRPVLETAHARLQLRALFPHISGHYKTLYLSRTIRWPFSQDLPYVRYLGPGRYEVAKENPPGGEIVLGEGDAEEAADLLIAHLPLPRP